MKKNYVIIFLFIITISLVACTNNLTLDDKDEASSESLPILKVVSDNSSIKAEMSASSWTIHNNDGTYSSIESLAQTPIEIVKDMDSLEVSPESKLQLDFSDDPKDITVTIWKENKQSDQVSTDMKITLPDLEGLLIYEVIANWKEGTIHYVFSVDIE